MSSVAVKSFLVGSIIGGCALLLSACKKDETPVGVPPDSRPLITAQDFGKLVLAMTDYDVVRVTHQLGRELRSRNVVRIGVGTKDSTGYKPLLVDSTRYDAGAQAYIVRFDYSVSMDSSKRVASLTVRYYLSDSTFTDADTSVVLYKYPYPSAEVYIEYPTVYPYYYQLLLQDIAQTDSLFFFHPLGPEGLYEYNPATGRSRELVPYSAGDHIAAHSSLVFYEDRNRGVGRLDMRTLRDTILFSPYTYPRIIGMDVFGGFLYLWVGFGNTTLKKYKLHGVLLDSLEIPASNCYYMTIHDSIVYTVNYGIRPERLSRFSLRTRSFLPDVLAPAKDTDGIKAFRDQLYFTDYNKRHVGVMPIADLRTPN